MTSTPPAPDLVTRVHIDTDPGLDDLLALALALASPELRVVSVSTVAGNASIDAVTQNAQRFLALAGVALPVGRGAEEPIRLQPARGESFHGSDGRGGVPIAALDRRPVPPARDVLRDTLAERRADRIVALGPLTNLALLLDESPELFEGVEIVWMGGSLSAGNVTPVAEFNAYADPVAAAIVLGSGFPVRVIGLDVTESVRLRPEDLPDGALGTGAGDLGRFVGAVVRALMRAEERTSRRLEAALHDPCAVLAATALDLFRYEPKRLDVIAEEGRERGRLVEMPAPTLARGVVEYAVEARTDWVRRLVVERLAAWCGA